MTRPFARYIYALTWSAGITFLLLQSSREPVVGPAVPEGELSLAYELLLFAGHLTSFSILTLLWWWAFEARLTFWRSIWMAIGIAVCMGIVTELLQSFAPDRETSWFDLITNTSVTFVMAGGITFFHQRE